MKRRFMVVWLLAGLLRFEAVQAQETVRPIAPARQPLPPEDLSASVSRFSFIVYGDSRGRIDRIENQYEHSLVVEGILAAIKRLEPTDYPVRFIMQTGDAVPGLSRNEMHANCIETLKRGGEIAAENSIELLIENIDPEENPKYFLTLSAEGFEIVRSVGNPHVKFLYDFFHEQIAAGNLIAKLEKNIDLIGLVHVADVPGRHDPGTGEIYYPNIFRKLGELGYSRYVAMEFMPKGETVPALRAAREMAIKFGRPDKKQSSNTLHSGRFYASA